MKMKNILSLSERLVALIEKAEVEAEEIVSKAQKQMEDSLAKVREETERKRQRAQRRTGLDEFLVEAEAEAKKEAKKVTKDYEERVKEIRNISDDKIKEAVDYVLQEVLPK
jgi:vacuolar-type H+-ATPase subunit H